jgi:hypothetical protein
MRNTGHHGIDPTGSAGSSRIEFYEERLELPGIFRLSLTGILHAAGRNRDPPLQGCSARSENIDAEAAGDFMLCQFAIRKI